MRPLLAVLAALMAPLAAKERPSPRCIETWRRRCATATPTELGQLIHTAPNDEFLAIAIDEAARRTPHAQRRAADAAGEVG